MTTHRKIVLTAYSTLLQSGEIDPVTRSNFQAGEVIILCEEGKRGAIRLSSFNSEHLTICPFCGRSIRHIQIGETEYGGDPQPQEQQPHPSQSPRPRAPTYAHLRVTHPDGRIQTFYPLPEEFTIGRRSTNSLQLRYRKISRNHARIMKANNGLWYLQDLQSTNGTLYNHIPTSATRLYSGDHIKIDKVEMLFNLH